jgi:putative FmdB family regulatory protein
MPLYTYRREDGTTFDFRQSFADDPLTTDPDTGQRVTRVVQAAGIVFKGSGFYVNDSKNASKKSLSTPTPTNGDGNTSPSSSESADKPAETKKADAAPAAAD